MNDEVKSVADTLRDLKHENRDLREYAGELARIAQEFMDAFGPAEWGTPEHGAEIMHPICKKAYNGFRAALSKNTSTDAPESRQGTDSSEPKNSYPAASGATLSDSSGASGASTNSDDVERGPGFEAFRWTGHLRSFEAEFGQTCSVDFGEKLSVPSGVQGQYLRVWCGSWVIRRKDGKCFVLSDDNYRYAQEEWHAFTPYGTAVLGVGNAELDRIFSWLCKCGGEISTTLDVCCFCWRDRAASEVLSQGNAGPRE